MNRGMMCAGLIAAAVACGRPAPEPVVQPGPALVVDLDIDAAAAEPPPAEPVEPPAPAVVDSGPRQVGERLPVLPQPCDDPGLRVDEIDLDGNGTADVRKLMAPGAAGDWLACKLTDLDLDGDFDMAALYDEGGHLTAQYLDVDFDGQVDVATWYEPASGAMVAVARDLDGDGVVDAVDAP